MKASRGKTDAFMLWEALVTVTSIPVRVLLLPVAAIRHAAAVMEADRESMAVKMEFSRYVMALQIEQRKALEIVRTSLDARKRLRQEALARVRTRQDAEQAWRLITIADALLAKAAEQSSARTR